MYQNFKKSNGNDRYAGIYIVYKRKRRKYKYRENYFFANEKSTELITESVKLKIIAHKKLSMVNPGMSASVISSKRRPRTSEKRPRVIIVIGSVKSVRIGFTNAFMIPSTRATIRAVVKSATCTPGRI